MHTINWGPPPSNVGFNTRSAPQSAYPATSVVASYGAPAMMLGPPVREQVALVDPYLTQRPIHSPASATSAHRLCTEDRLIWLNDSLDDAVKAFDSIDEQLISEGKDPLSRVMVAPEYFFAKPLPEDASSDYYDSSGEDKQLTEQEKNSIVDRLKEMSARHPDVLLLPGTISFKKSVEREETPEQYASRKGEGLPPPIRAQFEEMFNEKEPRLDKAFRKHDRALATGAYDKNLFLSRQTDSLSPSTTHIVKNTSYALLGGNIVHKHNKVAGFHEITVHGENERRAFIPGDLNQGNFNFRGTSHSFEICGDHSNHLASESHEGPGKVHIIQSAAVANELTPRIRQNADYMVHSSNIGYTAGQLTINGVIDTTAGNFLSPEEPRLNADGDEESSAVQVYVLGETL